MGMRLEVNHPLYALAWICAGEILARLARWRCTGIVPWSGRFGPLVVLACIAGVLALPAFIKADPARFFMVSDPFLWKLHIDHILEFKNVFDRIRSLGASGLMMVASVILLVGVFIIRFFFLKELGRPWKTLLLVVFAPSVVVTLLGVLQVRWLGVAYGLWIAALPVWLASAVAIAPAYRFARWERCVAVLFAIAMVLQYPQSLFSSVVMTIRKGPLVSTSDQYLMAIRELAHYMKRQAGDKEIVVLSGPTTTTWMMYYGGMKGVGTLYWENTEGLKAAASAYAAGTDDQALKLLKERGVTHVAVFSIDAFSSQYSELIRHLPSGSNPRDTFGYRLLFEGKMPRWVTPLNFKMPREFGKEWVAVAEVHPDQQDAEARLGVARWQASRGHFPEAIQAFRDAAKADPRLHDAQLELAALLFVAGETVEAREHLDIGLAGEAPDKIAEVCFSIATHCQDAGQHAAAVELLRRAMESAPAVPSIRNLLAWLLATSKEASVRNPEEALVIAATNVGFFGRSAYFNALAAAQAANGQYQDAVETAKQAVEAGKSQGDPPAAIGAFEERLQLYEAGKPFQE